jgi:iron complex transport system substrate-binding protein
VAATPTEVPQPTDAPTDAPTAEPQPTPEFPLTLTDDEGTEVTLDSEPQRVVSLTPANTEIVFAVGAGDLLVGGTDFDDYPPEAAELPDVVQGVTVLTEQIVDLEPDLVLAGGNNFTPTADVERLRDLEIPVLVVYPQTVDEVMADISLIGTAVGAGPEAAEIVSGMESRIDEVTTALEGAETPRTFYEIGFEPEIYAPAPESFVADMVELAGGDAITTNDPALFSIPLEQLVDADPEVIVLGDAQYGTCPDAVASRPGWEEMTAVQNDAVVPVYDTIVTRPGPRLAEGLAALALAIHPEAEIAPPADLPELCV